MVQMAPRVVIVPELQAVIFDGKYIIDDAYESVLSHVHLDGVQRDRVHVSAPLKDAFPRIGDEKKILMVDFAFTVLQGRASRSGFVAVPINQQSNDLRASNLTLLPGDDRKLYRCTDVVPRDGISIGDKRFLPRSATIIKSTTPGQYQFKVTIDGKRKVFGFEAAQSVNVFNEKIVPLLVANDPDYHAKDAVYQDLCSSYFVAFPHEATTEVPPPAPPKPMENVFQPRCKAQLELKKKKREDALSNVIVLEKDGLRKCKTCAAALPFDRFEATRLECMGCRQSSRTERARSTSTRDQASIPVPAECVSCGKGSDEVSFGWRSDVLFGSWRNECTSCYNAKDYSVTSRARSREKDEEGYLRRNATTHLEWAHMNPEKVKEQQRLNVAVPERKMKTIVTSARCRGIEVAAEDVFEMQGKLVLECVYCGFAPSESDPLNGLDRVDSALGYTASNTVPCCATCNAMKGPLHVDVFVHNVRRIAAHLHIEGASGGSPRTRLAPFSGSAELRDAKRAKDKTDHLPEGMAVALWSSACHLCGRSPAMGIDRMDSDGMYVPENAFPCCTDCNYMKKHHAMSDFSDHVGFVDAHTRWWVIADVANLPMLTFGGKTREPVAALGDDGRILMVFPSIGCAAKLVGVQKQMLQRALGVGLCRGRAWSKVPPSVYKAQHVEPADAMAVISSLRL